MELRAGTRKTAALVVRFEELEPSGMAVGRPQYGHGPVVQSFGVLPGEVARLRTVRRRRGILLAEPEEILAAAPQRVAPRELHYLSCSPWQVMTYDAQVESKARILAKLFSEAAGREIRLAGFHRSRQQFGYRNKLEFSFSERDGALRLAFFARFGPFRKIALEGGCVLGTQAMNAAAEEVLAGLNVANVPLAMLKSLVVRQSRTTGDVITVLFVHGEDFPAVECHLAHSAGFVLAMSHPQSPASVITKILRRQGKLELEEEIAGIRVAYPFDGFFQNHVGLFAAVLARIREYLPPVGRIVELYAGVGVIGLALRDRAQGIVAIEAHPASVEFARRNAERLAADHYEVREGAAERVSLDLLHSADVLLVDPPRTGLHPKLVNKILDARPRRIVYLSCNPQNQARDCALLREGYEPVALEGFDFYPQTPHIESLLILHNRSS